MRKPLVFVISISFLFGLLAGILFFDSSQQHDRKHPHQKSDIQSAIEEPKLKNVPPVVHPEVLAEEDSYVPIGHTTVEQDGVSVWQADNGLYVGVAGEGTLLAVKDDTELTIKDGTYVAITTASVSPGGNYVYYCQQESMENPVCKNYVYDINKNGVYRVQHENQPLASDVDSLTHSWSEEGQLKINDLVSAQALQPWLLVAQ